MTIIAQSKIKETDETKLYIQRQKLLEFSISLEQTRSKTMLIFQLAMKYFHNLQ